MATIKVYENAQQLSIEAAELFVKTVEQAVQSRGICHVSLAGGGTPRKTYELLRSEPYCSRLPWQAIHFYWGDERCVPQTHSLSNQEMARQAFLNHVAIPEENIHPIIYEDSPCDAAKNYEKVLHSTFSHQAPQFDFVFLGLGDDGHTASLFPGTDVLKVQNDWVSHVYLQEQDMYRVTLTPEILNQARMIAFLVTGQGKAQVIQKILEKTSASQSFPAQLIRPTHGEVYWLLDEEAASFLQSDINNT
ncbi:6-phosphogluconolactonase [Pelosinus sp. sgz500959]|uniref:6-phosphogluconolactonase n=1 Tax=Pelosinus sp. sgz500959 TaxID=3242472 RepID=UPI0036701522